jgi:hypothetical protein
MYIFAELLLLLPPSSLRERALWTGRPDWSKFRLLLCAVFLKKNSEAAQFFGPLFTTVKIVYYFGRKCVVLNFGRFFVKRIWSPCLWTL